jgi:fermentation-respiration switch protein FrsA (DUF1100 family)
MYGSQPGRKSPITRIGSYLDGQTAAALPARHLMRRSDLVAIGCKADIARASQIGRLLTQSVGSPRGAIRRWARAFGPTLRAAFFLEFLADHSVDRTAPGAAEEDRGINEREQQRKFVTTVQA